MNWQIYDTPSCNPINKVIVIFSEIFWNISPLFLLYVARHLYVALPRKKENLIFFNTSVK